VTLNDNFTLNCCAQVGLRLEFVRILFENNCAKNNKDPKNPAAKCSAWTLVSGDIRFMRIPVFAGVLKFCKFSLDLYACLCRSGDSTNYRRPTVLK